MDTVAFWDMEKSVNTVRMDQEPQFPVSQMECILIELEITATYENFPKIAENVQFYADAHLMTGTTSSSLID